MNKQIPISKLLAAGLGPEWQDALAPALRSTRFKDPRELIRALAVELEPGFGMVIRPNTRSKSNAQHFPVTSARESVQWTLVFRLNQAARRAGRSAAKNLFLEMNQNRRAFGVGNVFKLRLAERPGGGPPDSALEFAMPCVPGTGSLVIAIVRGRVLVSNSGPMLHALCRRDTRERRLPKLGDLAWRRDKSRGRVWVDRKKLPAVVKALGRAETPELLEQGELPAWIRLVFNR